MKRPPKTAAFAGTAFCAAAVLAAVALLRFGSDTTGLDRSLQASGLLFVCSVLASLCRQRAEDPVRSGVRNGILARARVQPGVRLRANGSAGLFVWLIRFPSRRHRSSALCVVRRWPGLDLRHRRDFVRVRPCDRPRMLPPGLSRPRHGIISLAFLFSFLSHPLHGHLRSLLLYVPLVTVSVLGTLLRFGAWASRGAAVTKSA